MLLIAMTARETRWKRLIVRWTAPKGFVAILLFLAVILLLEFLLVYFFRSAGLTDEYTWTGTLHVPYVNQRLSLTLSPMFHLLPLSVVVVLLSSWTFLTKYVAFIPHITQSAKKTTAKKQRPPLKRRFKSVRNFARRINRKIQRIASSLKEAFSRIPGVSKLSRRLFFARAAVRSALIILSVFASFAFIAYTMAYPWWIHDAVVGLYRANPSLRMFVIGTNQKLQSIGKTLTPIRSATKSINDALLSAAPSFRRNLQNLGGFLEPVSKLSVAEKYLLVQNLAAWVCALIALAYGKYFGSRRYKRR
jgi:hypothetical protein